MLLRSEDDYAAMLRDYATLEAGDRTLGAPPPTVVIAVEPLTGSQVSV